MIPTQRADTHTLTNRVRIHLSTELESTSARIQHSYIDKRPAEQKNVEHMDGIVKTVFD